MCPEPESAPVREIAPAPDPKRALLKFLLEFGPLLLFFVLNKTHGIIPATGGFLVAALAAFPCAWRLEGKLPQMLLFGTVAIGLFGGLTWYFEDEYFIKIKPTVFSAGVGCALLVGLRFDRLFLKKLFGASLNLTREGWRKFTLRYGVFFLCIAVLNEFVWRNTDTDTWVSFKVFGILPLTFVFILFQVGLMKRYELPEAGDSEDDASA
jgi:intracellular septation protein